MAVVWPAIAHPWPTKPVLPLAPLHPAVHFASFRAAFIFHVTMMSCQAIIVTRRIFLGLYEAKLLFALAFREFGRAVCQDPESELLGFALPLSFREVEYGQSDYLVALVA